MKFGESLYQRSVPKWASYNVNYNELKQLIKSRTSNGTAGPVSIPGAGVSRWQQLDDELYCVIQDQYSNVALFLRSKQGEIERRLTHLEKQVRIAHRAALENAFDRPILQARKYQRLVKDAEAIGDEIENLSRFSNVQKTAFRKILKKYRKWTGSTSLQTRLDVKVFSSGALQVDYADYLHRLATQSKVISEELAAPMLTGQMKPASSTNQISTSNRQRSYATALNDAVRDLSLTFDVAISSVPYGEVAGSAFYWIHPDNFEEAEALLLRHMRALRFNNSSGTNESTHAFRALNGQTSSAGIKPTWVYNAFYDNVHRFTHERRSLTPSNIGLCACWASEPEAMVTMSNLAPKSSDTESIKLRRKNLAAVLERHTNQSKDSFQKDPAAKRVQAFLSENRDVKPLAQLTSARSRYIGITNSSEVGTWATLDSSISMAPIDSEQLGQPEPVMEAGQAFPHAVLHIRWEFSRMPEVVRAFDNSHLAERVQDFTLEDAAIYTVVPDLEQPKWRHALSRDIRKIPSLMRAGGSSSDTRRKTDSMSSIPVSSGPSSTDGPSDSVFSAANRKSSVTSDDTSGAIVKQDRFAIDKGKGKDNSNQNDLNHKRKKRARILPPPRRDPSPQRYWNEFDDGDSDNNFQETYAIYVDPNEPSFPGAATVSKAFSTMYESFSRGTSRVISWLPLSTKKGKSKSLERAPLLSSADRTEPNIIDGDADSSGSETEEIIAQPSGRNSIHRTVSYGSQHRVGSRSDGRYRPHQKLTLRQKALERTLFQFYSGLITISYIFLGMAAILLGTGRRKEVLEVDAGVICGVVAAETCTMISVMLIFMRKMQLGVLHWGFMGVNVATIVVLGAAILTVTFAGR